MTCRGKVYLYFSPDHASEGVKVTLNDLEWHNGRAFCVIWPNSVAFVADYVKVVEDTPIHSASDA